MQTSSIAYHPYLALGKCGTRVVAKVITLTVVKVTAKHVAARLEGHRLCRWYDRAECFTYKVDAQAALRMKIKGAVGALTGTLIKVEEELKILKTA